MKKILFGILVVAITEMAQAYLLPNGDFDNGTAEWTFGGSATFTHVASGGNGGGYLEIDGTGGWGVAHTAKYPTLKLSDYGLVGGDTIEIVWDMKAISAGTGDPGIKIESWLWDAPDPSTELHNSGDIVFPYVGDVWRTVRCKYTLDPAATGFIVVLLWGDGGVYGYDNIQIYKVAPEPLVVTPGESIQDAIDAASYGDTIQVTPGTYVENIILKNGVALIGDRFSTPIIDGNGAGPAVYSYVCDPNTILQGFTITNGDWPYGGGMRIDGGIPTVTNCTFSSNSAELGGGMYIYVSSPTVTNCLFSGNSADLGGGMYVNESSATVTNCVFSGNTASSGGGGMFINFIGSPTVTNCIIQNGFVDMGNAVVSYCNVAGGYPGTGNINADPLWDFDFKLLAGSPCIDAGNNFAVPAGITTDLSGWYHRFKDDPETGDTGNGTAPIVDMGVYEFYNPDFFYVIAVFSADPNPAGPGQTITFDASASYCSDPFQWIVSYEWDFDYDGVTFDVDDTGVTVTHTYGSFGDYNAALRVTDAGGQFDEEIITVEVLAGNNPPTADAGGAYTVNQNQSLTIDASASTPGGDDATYGDAVVLYEWDLESDGQYDDHITTDAVTTVPWTTLSTLSRPVANPPISLRVTDKTGLTDTATTALTITDYPISLGTVTVDSNGDVGINPSLALDETDNPHISYWDYSNRNLEYAFWNGTSWTIQTVDGDINVGDYSSLALDSTGKPSISYYDYSSGDLKYAYHNGSSWIIQIVDSTGNVGMHTSLALDSSDNPHISYYDVSNGDLEYAAWNGSGWGIETVDSTGNVGKYTCLDLDSLGNPHISYYDDSNDDLKYAAWNGTTWDIETVDSPGNVGQYTCIALDSSDNPHISYYDVTNEDLNYAKWYGSGWLMRNVNSNGIVGMYTSMALDSSDNPHISYYDVTNEDLKYAFWNGSSWTVDIADSPAYVGEHRTSLALDSSDNPFISYYDYNNVNLKLVVPCVGNIPGDVNKDCFVNLLDVAELAARWLDCSVPYDPACLP